MIPVSRPFILKSDANAVSDAIKSTFIAGGDSLEKFQRTIAYYCKRRYAVAITNATSALFLAVSSLNLSKKSRILIPSFTIVSVLNAVLQNGHTPVFIDVDPNTWNMSAESVERAVKEKIDAAIIVETYASAPPMKKIINILKRYKIPCIEDSAEGFGGSEGEARFGSFGDISVLSFYANKLITTGEGGMILTDNKDYYERANSLRNLCFDQERKYIHSGMSGNFRFTNMQAALGLSQFKRIEKMYSHRKNLYNLYVQLLSDLQSSHVTFEYVPKEIKSSYWVFPVLINNISEISLAGLINILKKRGIESRHFFYPLDRQPYLQNSKPLSEVSLNLWKKGLYLPLGNGIKESEVKEAARIFREEILKIKK